jgi:hypothetical protein
MILGDPVAEEINLHLAGYSIPVFTVTAGMFESFTSLLKAPTSS